MAELMDTLCSIHLRLHAILIADVLSPISDLNKSVGHLGRAANEYSELASSIQCYLDSSQMIINAIIKWNEMQLLSDNYTSSLNFQIGLAISFLNDRLLEKRMLIKNNTTDLPETRFSIPLLKLVFVNLLLYKFQLSDKSEILEIENYLSGDKLVISLLFQKQDSGLADLITNIQKKDFAGDDPQVLLSLCYKFLHLYGCGIWSENSEKDGLKVSFSIPTKKCN